MLYCKILSELALKRFCCLSYYICTYPLTRQRGQTGRKGRTGRTGGTGHKKALKKGTIV